ncbi:MAG: DUF896 domain-containing protein [Acetatifactor sp.]|nr:DUF896 domain-containing protein [Acetatifactor sp.]
MDRTLDQKIARINALYHKSQTEGLTEEEKAEQATLRQEYVANVRANLRGQLNSITIQREDGTLENLGEKYGCCASTADQRNTAGAAGSMQEQDKYDGK